MVAQLIDRLRNNLSWQKIVGNVSWLSFEHLFRVGLGFVVSILLARYLGPEGFGLLSYTIALVSIVGPVAGMGLDTILVKQLVHYPDAHSEILGAGLLLRLMGGAIAFGLCLILISQLRSGDAIAFSLVAILAVNHLLRSFDVFKYWFESQVISRPVVIVQVSVYSLMTLLKLVLIYRNAPLVDFVYVMLLECFLISVGICVLYLRKVEVLRWGVLPWSRCIALLRQSWPLMFSGVAILLYMRLDKIMLGQMVGDDAVGVYSVATGLSEAWHFVPMVVLTSLFPSILKLKGSHPDKYQERFQGLMDVGVGFGLLVGVCVSLLAPLIIGVLYGERYESAAQILAIHTWAFMFVILGVIGGRWYIAENLEKIVFYRTVAGAVINIILNLLLIPAYGAIGAAVATVIAQMSASVLFNVVNSETRSLFYMQCRALSFNRFWKRG